MKIWQRVHWFEDRLCAVTYRAYMVFLSSLYANYLYHSSHCLYKYLFSVRNAEIMRQLLRRSGGASNICRWRIYTLCFSFVDTKGNTITESLLHINTNNHYWKLNTVHAVSAHISLYFHFLRKKKAYGTPTTFPCTKFSKKMTDFQV
jgi:hypothetical protein